MLLMYQFLCQLCSPSDEPYGLGKIMAIILLVIVLYTKQSCMFAGGLGWMSVLCGCWMISRQRLLLPKPFFSLRLSPPHYSFMSTD
jgi:hypothetical protein